MIEFCCEPWFWLKVRPRHRSHQQLSSAQIFHLTTPCNCVFADALRVFFAPICVVAGSRLRITRWGCLLRRGPRPPRRAGWSRRRHCSWPHPSWSHRSAAPLLPAERWWLKFMWGCFRIRGVGRAILPIARVPVQGSNCFALICSFVCPFIIRIRKNQVASSVSIVCSFLFSYENRHLFLFKWPDGQSAYIYKTGWDDHCWADSIIDLATSAFDLTILTALQQAPGHLYNLWIRGPTRQIFPSVSYPYRLAFLPCRFSAGRRHSLFF
jgi:hypothetical protein